MEHDTPALFFGEKTTIYAAAEPAIKISQRAELFLFVYFDQVL